MIRMPKHFCSLAAIGIALLADLPAVAQQAAASYLHATRYNSSGQVTGTISPDPDGAGTLKYIATRNTYGTSGATAGLLIKIEQGELASWPSEAIAVNAWESYGFTVFITRAFTYDSSGRKKTESVTGADSITESVTQYSYDGWDRVTCRAVRMNKAAFGSLPSDACQLGPEGSHGPDRITRFTYNIFSQVLTEERAVGTSIAQTYVTNTYEVGAPLLRYQTDAKGNKTELQYDEHFRLKKRIYPSPTTAGSVNNIDFNEYHYDNNRNVVYEQKRDGRYIVNTFDANNRPIFKDLSDNTYSGDITYDYDLRGLSLSSCFGTSDSCIGSGAGETNVFDGFGNLVSSTSRLAGTARTLTYQYDAESNRTRVTHPDGWYFKYGFDGLNRLNSLDESTAANPSATTSNLLTITYWQGGGRMDIVRPNGDVTNVNLDPVLRLDSFTQNFAGTANDLTNGFDYNPANQVVLLSQSNASYTFNQMGSRAGTYASNGLNQYTSIAGPTQTLTYSPNGNLISDVGANMSYTYDMENHLVSTGGAASSTLSYDVMGRLAQLSVASVTTQFQYDGDALVGEYVGGVLQRRYVHGDQVDEPLVQYNSASVGPSYRRYVHADHQGSVIAQSDSTGVVIVKNSYDSYGIPGPANDGRFGYTGQAWVPQLGLNYYKARFYSPKLGRFLQTDPIFYQDGMNLYGYVSNDPVNRRDPTGETEEALPEIVITYRRPVPKLLIATKEAAKVTTAEAAAILAIPLMIATPSNGWSGSNEIACRDEAACIIWMANNKPPADAKDPNGAKAPGKPGAAEGFEDPKDGEKWVRGPDDRGGWLDSKGNIWQPTGPGSRAHGGAHWDVQKPGGGYDNVFPGGRRT